MAYLNVFCHDKWLFKWNFPVFVSADNHKYGQSISFLYFWKLTIFIFMLDLCLVSIMYSYAEKNLSTEEKTPRKKAWIFEADE